jgi:hypothetical protein
MSAPALTCPRCQSTSFVKNGRIHNGRQNFKCKACGRQFVFNPTKKVIGQDTRALIDKLLLEKLPLFRDCQGDWGVCCVGYKHMSIISTMPFLSKLRFVRKKGALNCPVRCDLWSFVSNKGNKQWIWLALDMKTGEIVGVFVGDRSRSGADGLWQSLPGVYRQCAVCGCRFLGGI